MRGFKDALSTDGEGSSEPRPAVAATLTQAQSSQGPIAAE
jgi:hypothetical protein